MGAIALSQTQLPNICLILRKDSQTDAPRIFHGPMLGSIGVDEVFIYSDKTTLRQAVYVTYI